MRTLLQHVKTDVNTRDNQGKIYDGMIMVCGEYGVMALTFVSAPDQDKVLERDSAAPSRARAL